MISKDTLKFLNELEVNNNKEWFQSHQNEYKEAKQDFRNLAELIAAKISEFDDKINPESDIYFFRINRDIRFSKDKSPYKSHFSCLISPGGRKSRYASYYLQIKPHNESFVGGGKYEMSSDQLLSIRKLISNKYDDFLDIIGNNDFQKHFKDIDSDDKLIRIPKGFDKIDPAADYLKLKHFTAIKNIKDSDITSKKLFEQLSQLYKIINPLNDFLNKAL